MSRGLLAAALALLAGCSSAPREAERAIRAYNEAAIAAYKLHDASRLAPVSTERQQRKVAQLIDFKVMGKLVLESTLESLELLAASEPGPGRLAASTRERWRYFDRPLEPGAAAGQVFVVVMELDYELARDGGAWKVDAIRARKSDYLEPKGYRLDTAAPAHSAPAPAPGAAPEPSGAR